MTNERYKPRSIDNYLARLELNRQSINDEDEKLRIIRSIIDCEIEKGIRNYLAGYAGIMDLGEEIE